VVVRAVNVDGTVGEGDVMVPELLVAGIIILRISHWFLRTT
jgi:hypothetical protein